MKNRQNNKKTKQLSVHKLNGDQVFFLISYPRLFCKHRLSCVWTGCTSVCISIRCVSTCCRMKWERKHRKHVVLLEYLRKRLLMSPWRSLTLSICKTSWQHCTYSCIQFPPLTVGSSPTPPLPVSQHALQQQTVSAGAADVGGKCVSGNRDGSNHSTSSSTYHPARVLLTASSLSTHSSTLLHFILKY